MEESSNQTQTPAFIKPKNKYWKFVLVFLALILGACILYGVAYWALMISGQKGVQNLAEEMKRVEQEK